MVASILAAAFVMSVSGFSLSSLRLVDCPSKLRLNAVQCAHISGVEEFKWKASLESSKSTLLSLLLASTLVMPNLAMPMAGFAAAPEVNDIENFKVLKVILISASGLVVLGLLYIATCSVYQRRIIIVNRIVKRKHDTLKCFLLSMIHVSQGAASTQDSGTRRTITRGTVLEGGNFEGKKLIGVSFQQERLGEAGAGRE